MIQPVQGRLLVEIKGAFKNIKVTEGQWDANTRGLVHAIATDVEEDCKDLGIKIGSTVYFGKYEDNAKCLIDGKDGALMPLKEIAGVENE